MSTALTNREPQAQQIERVLIEGNLAQLKTEDRVAYYNMVCESVGLNPLTKPFDYITLNGKLTLYARKDATDQLRQIHGVSVEIVAREVMDDCYVVTANAKLPTGRTDSSIGAVPIGTLKGEAKCNAMMKAETKAKRRVTLSICGLGMLDELEIETIPGARKAIDIQVTQEEIQLGAPGESAGAVVAVEPAKSANTSGGTSGSPAVEYITPEQATSLHIYFKDFLDRGIRKKADSYLEAWCKAKGFVDAGGAGTTKAIKATYTKNGQEVSGFTEAKMALELHALDLNAKMSESK